MSKKEQAIELFKTLMNSASSRMYHAALYDQNGSYSNYEKADYFNAIMAQSGTKFAVMMGVAPAEYFGALIEQKSATFGCNDFDSFECIDIAKEIGLSVLETWIWTE